MWPSLKKKQHTSGPETKLFADYISISCIVEVITDSTPGVVVANFHTAIEIGIPISQTQISIITACEKKNYTHILILLDLDINSLEQQVFHVRFFRHFIHTLQEYYFALKLILLTWP